MSSSEIRVDTIKTRAGLGTVTISPSGLQFSGIVTSENRLDVKSYDGTPGRLDLYCESSNVHYARIQAPDHADFSGNVTLTLPNTAGTLLNSDVSGNVGIGTDNPQHQINTFGNSSSGGILVQNVLYASNVNRPYLIAGTQNHDGTTASWGKFGFQHRIKSNSSGNGRVTIDTLNGEAFCVSNNKNIGIGTDDPTELLHLSADSAHEILLKRGGGSPSEVRFANEGNLAVISNNTNGIVFETGATPTAAMIIESSGNVGIGTDNPQQLLDIFQDDATDTVVQIRSGTANREKARITKVNRTTGNGDLQIQSSSGANGHSMVFLTDSSGEERMHIDSSGNVGIGTGVPLASLDIDSGIGASDQALLVSDTASIPENTDFTAQISSYGQNSSGLNGSKGGLFVHAGFNRDIDIARFSSIGSGYIDVPRMVIKDSGLIGIGTTNPQVKLDVGGAATGGLAGLSNSVAYFGFDQSSNLFSGVVLGAGANGNTPFVAAAQKSDGTGLPLTFFTDGSERLRIADSGNVIFGTATSTQITAGTADGKFFQGSDANFISSKASAAAATHQSFVNSNGAVGSITTSGSNTAYNTSSDYRLKENVVDLDGAIDRVKQLAPRRFNFIADADTTVDGFLAHEAQSVVPEAVTGTHNEVDDDGNPVYQGIDQSKFVPLLTAALQEAIAKIETLEAQNTDLVARIEALEQA